MDAQQIKVFIDAMAASDLRELEVSHEGWTLRLVRGGGHFQPVQSTEAMASVGRVEPEGNPRRNDDGPQDLPAPMFGIVHLQPSPGAAPFIQPGDAIAPGQLLCTIEAMKVFNEVRAEHGGRVTAILVASGTEVEAGQPLLKIEQVPHV